MYKPFKMKHLLIVALFISVSCLDASAQCKVIRTGLKALNNNDIDSAKSTLDSASVLIKENGLESIGDRCLAKYYYGKAVLKLMDGRDEDNVTAKAKIFNESEEWYLKFLKLGDKPKTLEESTQSNLISLSIEFINTGVEYYQLAKYDTALTLIEKGIRMKRRYDATKIKDQDLFNALVCAKMVKNYGKALTYADTLLGKKNNKEKTIQYLEQKTEVLSASGQDSLALELLDSLSFLGGDEQRIEMARLQIHMNRGEDKEALQAVNGLIKQMKNQAKMWNIKAQLEYSLGMVDSAIVSFGNTLQLEESNYSGLYGLGIIYTNKGNRNVERVYDTDAEDEKEKYREQVRLDFGVAIGYFNRILDKQSNDINSLNALLAIYTSLDDEVNKTVIKEKIKIAQSDE